MTDGTLLLFGCAVSFIALAGAYVYIRERFTAPEPASRPAREPRRQLQEAA